MKGKVPAYNPEPYSANPDIVVFYELPFKNDTIKPGDKIKFRGTMGWFRFERVAHNQKIDSTWIDCRNDETGEFRSFHVDKLREVNRPKKSRRKKKNVE